MITKEELKQIAQVAKFDFSDDDLDMMYEDINATIELIQNLKEVDTEGVQPTFYGNANHDVYREDKAVDSGKRDRLLANAPDSDEGYIRVPVILETEEA
ncbi:Asp-tRNA(Asn)/Glu-tRNA(Gln) amidotransferase subunit GatC [Hutsoniella sourekii]|uniref:Asp-tRNA(Asn)/Glu-tRNA(Gln) amidotransferase subunit GatC n=1 Tax=Hutsoniella sourekii TaxID=87650 RepID=UPI0004864FE9|nr:Asp-tRNA(Asn)/Glu-tRNA(Gln) amidotransferase subunit GatC [Hutsoniella sourekii]